MKNKTSKENRSMQLMTIRHIVKESCWQVVSIGFEYELSEKYCSLALTELVMRNLLDHREEIIKLFIDAKIQTFSDFEIRKAVKNSKHKQFYTKLASTFIQSGVIQTTDVFPIITKNKIINELSENIRRLEYTIDQNIFNSDYIDNCIATLESYKKQLKTFEQGAA